MPSFPEDDEETLLYTNTPTYGCITSSPLSHPQQRSAANQGSHRSQEESSSRGSSDGDDTSSSRLAKRKQRRLQQRHRPKLSSRLSSVLRVTTSEAMAGPIEEGNPDLVLPALDPR